MKSNTLRQSKELDYIYIYIYIMQSVVKYNLLDYTSLIQKASPTHSQYYMKDFRGISVLNIY
jgi:hypothetical protein